MYENSPNYCTLKYYVLGGCFHRVNVISHNYVLAKLILVSAFLTTPVEETKCITLFTKDFCKMLNIQDTKQIINV